MIGNVNTWKVHGTVYCQLSWLCRFISSWCASVGLVSAPALKYDLVAGAGVQEPDHGLDVDHARVGEGGGEGEGLQEAGQEEEELLLGELDCTMWGTPASVRRTCTGADSPANVHSSVTGTSTTLCCSGV